MPRYHITIKGQKYDRALYETALKAVEKQGDGRVSRDDAEKLLEKVLDAAPGQQDAYTDVEKRTVRLLREQLNWTPAADQHFRHAVASVAALKGWQTRLAGAGTATSAVTPNPPLTVTEFIEKIVQAWPRSQSGRAPRLSADGVPTGSYQKVSDQLRADLTSVRFNTENTEYSGHYRGFRDFLGVKTLENGTPYLALSSGGDWEFPLCYVIYWDGDKLRGHIPEQGNVYNRTNKAAFGNLDEDEEATEIKQQLEERGIDLPADRARGHWQDYVDLLADKDLLLQDIEAAITPR
jgi:hypothetical protein